MRRSALSLAVAFALILGLAACGEKMDPVSSAHEQSLTLMLDFFPNADHVGCLLYTSPSPRDRS